MIEKTPIVTYSGEENPYELVNYLDQARGLLTSQFQNKDILDRYLQILIQGKDDLQTVFSDVMQKRSLHNASGKQLDVIGNIVGQERQLFDSAIIYYFGFAGAVGASPYGTVSVEGSVGQWKSIDDPLLGVRELSDAEYRALIRIKIIKNTSNASVTALVDAANLLFGVDKVTYQEDEATITLNIGREFNDVGQAKFPGLDEVTLASRFLNVPIGVQLFLQPPETLVFDFENNSYDIYEEGNEVLQPKLFEEVVDFTRGSTGTYFDSAGIIQTAAVDEPRFTHDPITLEPQGLLIEEQRTNRITWSEVFDDPSWGMSNITVTSDAITAPDGTNTADKIVENTNNSNHGFFEVQAMTSGDKILTSIHVKAAERTKVRVQLDSTAFDPDARLDVDLTDGSIIGTLGGEDYVNVVPLPNGWYRLELGATAAVSANGGFAVYILESPGTAIYTGDGTSGIYVWGAQLEEGSFPTSYIKTEGSQVTRSADTVSRTLAEEFNREAFTIFLESDVLGDSTTTLSYFLRIGQSGGNASPDISLREEDNGDGKPRLVVRDSSTSVIVDRKFTNNHDKNKAKIALSVSEADSKIIATMNGESEVNVTVTGDLSDVVNNITTLFLARFGNEEFSELRLTPKDSTQTELMILTLPDGVTGTEVELDLTTDPSLELNFTDNYSIIQSEE